MDEFPRNTPGLSTGNIFLTRYEDRVEKLVAVSRQLTHRWSYRRSTK